MKKMAYTCIGIGIVCFIAYIIGLLCNDYDLFGTIADNDIARTGQIGDFFGGIVGSFWTLAGVLLYFSALRLQSQEIANQVKEMNDNKRLMNQQQFESSFFNLLHVQQDIKNNINEILYTVEFTVSGDYNYYKQEARGGDFFVKARGEINMLYKLFKHPTFNTWNEESILEDIDGHIRNQEQSPEPPEIEEENDAKFYESLKYAYLASVYRIKDRSYERLKTDNNEKELCAYLYYRFFLKYENSIGHYCRHLYNIVKFLNGYENELLEEANRITSLEEREKERKKISEKIKSYFSFIQSSLSTSEMFLLFYNTLLFDKARDLFIKYDMFENLMKERLIKSDYDHSNLIEGVNLKSTREFANQILKMVEK